MERLTERDKVGNWGLKRTQWENLLIGVPITQETYEALYGALCKLRDYEDTGLSPSEVEELRRQQDRCRWIPVGERLPSEKEFLKAYCRNHYAAEFLVMIKDATRPTTLYFLKDTKSWVDDERNHYTILAWQPLPEPYKGGQNET